MDRLNEKDHSMGNSGSAQEISRVVGIVPTKITAFVILILILILVLSRSFCARLSLAVLLELPNALRSCPPRPA